MAHDMRMTILVSLLQPPPEGAWMNLDWLSP